MKKIFLLLTLGLIAFVWVDRERIYIWDPIATVTRDGVKQEHVRTMINWSNDVFLDDASAVPARMYVVQHWDMALKYPTAIKGCIQYLACLADADHASGDAIRTATVKAESNGWEFMDEHGALVKVTLR